MSRQGLSRAPALTPELGFTSGVVANGAIIPDKTKWAKPPMDSMKESDRIDGASLRAYNHRAVFVLRRSEPCSL